MQRGSDPITADVNVVLDFLTDLFELGLGFSAINTARSALSSVILTDRGTVGNHPLVCKFMKGVSELRPTKPRYCETWDVSILLDYLNGLGDNECLSDKDLTLKLCALLLLLSAQRVQTVHLIRVENISFGDNGCVIRITDRLKHFSEKKMYIL